MLIALIEGSQGLTEVALDEDLEQRFWNCGFTEEEVFELACQGVKPWDEDAEAVLDVLNNGWDFYRAWNPSTSILQTKSSISPGRLNYTATTTTTLYTGGLTL